MTGTRTRTVAEVPLDRGTFVALANAMRGAGSPIPIDATETGNYIDGHGYMFVLTNTEVAAPDLPAKPIPVELNDVQFTVVAHEAIEQGYIPGPFNEKWDSLKFNGMYFTRWPGSAPANQPIPAKKGRVVVSLDDEAFSKAATDAINANLMEDEDAEVVKEWSTFMVGDVIFQRAAKPVPVSLSLDRDMFDNVVGRLSHSGYQVTDTQDLSTGITVPAVQVGPVLFMRESRTPGRFKQMVGDHRYVDGLRGGEHIVRVSGDAYVELRDMVRKAGMLATTVLNGEALLTFGLLLIGAKMGMGQALGLDKPVESKEQPITAQFLLDRGCDILDKRAAEYDQPGGERDMEAIAKAFNAVTKRDSEPWAISEAEGWLFMSILKQVRLFAAKSFHLDSAVDGCNYTALTGEAKARETK